MVGSEKVVSDIQTAGTWTTDRIIMTLGRFGQVSLQGKVRNNGPKV